MSPSTRDNSPIRLPLQPNPFSRFALGTGWAPDLLDVPAINQDPFQMIIRALRMMSVGGKGTSILLIGDPGSGKTHLLGRLRGQLLREQGETKSPAIYVYVRCNASAGTLWRHLRYALASDLMKGEGTSQLGLIFDAKNNRLEVEHEQTRHVLKHLRDGQLPQAAAAWLRGEGMIESDLAALDLRPDHNEEDHDKERESKLVVHALLKFIAPLPVVLCFDQVEALEIYRGDDNGFHAMAQMISELCLHDHLLLISCIISAFEDRLDRAVNDADRDRWVQQKGVLRSVDWDQAMQLAKARLDAATALKAPRSAHPDQPLWPLNPDLLKPLFKKTGFCRPRDLIRACEQQFNSLIDIDYDPASQPPPRALEEFLAEEYDRALSEARTVVRQQGLSKTLTDCLPWLLQSSGLAPVPSKTERYRFAHQIWRGPQGEETLAFCDGNSRSLTNQLKRIHSAETDKRSKLLIVRDPIVRPGTVGADYLSRLKRVGAQEVHPLPEALAVLQAIRNLLATARAGELVHDGQQITEQQVTDWAMENLPSPLEQLQAQLINFEQTELDPLLPRLAALLSEHKIMKACDAAQQLEVPEEELQNCAGRGRLRFGILVGPPVVIFEGTRSTR